MKHKCYIHATILVLAATILVSCTSKPGDPHPLGDQGFTEAFFDRSTVEELLGKSGCEVLRFYNVRRSSDDTDGTVLVIPAKADHGSDLYRYFGTWYRRYDKLDRDLALTTARAQAGALEGIGWVKDAGDASYATNFTATDIRTLLRTEGCNGIRLVPERQDDNWSMRMTAVEIADGTATELGLPEGEWICTQPCPSFCGTSGHYLHR